MTEAQAMKLLDRILEKVEPNQAGNWTKPVWLPENFASETREDWIQYLSRLAEVANLHLLPKELDRESFAAILSEPIIPMVIFCKNGPKLLADGSGDEIEAFIWKDGDYRSKMVTKAEMLETTLTETNGMVLILVPVKADPLVSGDQWKDGKKPTPFQRLLRLMVAERKEIVYIYIYALMVGLLSLTLPLGVQAIVGQVSGGLIMEPVVVLILLVVIGTAISGGLQIMQAYIVEKIQQRLFARAAFEFASRLPRLKVESILNFYPPELMNRFFDILTIQKGLSKILNDFIGAVLAILFGLLLLSFYHPFFIVFGLTLLVFLFLIFRLTGKKGLETSLVESKYKYRVAHWLEEIARTLRSFKLAGFSNLPMQKTDREVTSYLKVRKAHFQVLITQFSSIIIFKTVITGGLLILGSLLVVSKQITLGQFVASEIVIITILASVEKIFSGLDTIYDLLTAVEKIGTVTDLEMEKPGSFKLPFGKKGIELNIKNLTYTFPGNSSPSLKNISFHVAEGEKIGITGFNGAGKTTLLKVVTGLLQNYKGSIYYDDVPLRNLNLARMRLEVGDIHASGDIFEGTLLENLAMGRPGVKTNNVMDVVKMVGLEDYIGGLPDGFHTLLPAGGGNVPSGIIKRIILARNLIGPPRMLIFNDFFMNLEAHYRHKLKKSVLDKEQPWTVLAVTQDPIFLSDCHKILLLEEGELIAQGTYEEMMQNERFRIAVHNGDPS